jgi:hypothetical protein
MKQRDILAYAILAFCVLYPRSGVASVVSGLVFDSARCQGVGSVSIQFSPPRGSDKLVVSTAADRQGRFRVELSGEGEYYVSVYSGPQQVYGQAVKIQPQDLLYIALVPSTGESRPSGECERRMSNALLHQIRPIGLAFIKSGLLILDASADRVLEVKRNGVSELIKLAGATPIDIGTVRLGGDEDAVLIINEQQQTAGRSLGFVSMYTQVGMLRHSWQAPHGRQVFSGVAADVRTERAYFSAPLIGVPSTEIYRLDVTSRASNSQLQYVGAIHTDDPISDPIWSITVDTQNRRLLAASAMGTLSTADLPADHGGAFHVRHLHLQSALSSPRGIALDSSGQVLYAIANKRVWKLQIGLSPVTMERFASSHTFPDPSAIVIAPTGNIWIGDEHEHAVYEISPGGQVLSSVSAP